MAHAKLRIRRFFAKPAPIPTEGYFFIWKPSCADGSTWTARVFRQQSAVNDLNFAHIPIDVLSQIYETFSRRWDDAHSDDTSVHYTPKNIARLLVDEALTGLEEPQDAVVLDPACGGGIFLVLAFRELLRLHWKKTGRRPTTSLVHRVLYNQLRGFDISESALRLAALALYITSIEANGTTRPPKSLKFPDALKDQVLFNFGPVDHDERRQGFVLGSLAPNVPKSFDG